jgi:hypothetical protein
MANSMFKPKDIVTMNPSKGDKSWAEGQLLEVVAVVPPGATSTYRFADKPTDKTTLILRHLHGKSGFPYLCDPDNYSLVMRGCSGCHAEAS